MFAMRTKLLEVLPGITVLCTHSSDPTNELYVQLGAFRNIWNQEDCRFNIEALKNIHISGIQNVHNIIVENGVVIIPEILLSTDTLSEFAGCVDLNSLRSNDVVNTNQIFGIEAARELLRREMKNVLSFDGAYVNPRHIAVVCDSITHRGILRPMSRHGLFIDKRSVLSNASFEMCSTTFNNAAVRGNVDQLNGVAEQIIVGKPHDFGTGMMTLLLDEEKLIMQDVVENQTNYPVDLTDGPSYVPMSPEFTSMSSPLNQTFSPCPYSPTDSEAQFSPGPVSPRYSPSTPTYAPTTPTYAPASPIYSPSSSESSSEGDSQIYIPSSPILVPKVDELDWMEADLLEEVYS